MTSQLSSFTPDWISPPGDTIADLLEEKGWTQAELSVRSGFTRKHVNELVSGKASISPDAALRLEATIGGAADFWLTREAQYREALARRESEHLLAHYKGWLKELPLADMVRFGWIRKLASSGAQVAECLRFFGVATVDAWTDQYKNPLVAFRASDAVKKTVGAIAAWLRQGERQAQEIATAPYDERAFRSRLKEFRNLTRDTNPAVFQPALVQACAQVGVAVVFVPTPKGCPANGATKWLSPDKALMQLSLRYGTHDILWFTFFHEAGHILLHGKKMIFVEQTDNKGQLEQEADRFACDTLIPPSIWAHHPKAPVSRQDVLDFAEKAGIAPGIVLGRLQHEKLVPWPNFRDLKVGYRFAEPNEHNERR